MSNTAGMIRTDLLCRNVPIDNNIQTNRSLHQWIYILKLEPKRLREFWGESTEEGEQIKH